MLDYYGDGETLLDYYGEGNQSGFGGVDVQMELGGQPWSTGRSVDRRSSGPIWLIWFVGFFWLWVMVRFGRGLWVFFLFFLAVVGGDLVRLLVAGGGDDGWMWWLGYGWMDAVAGSVENNWVEKQRDRGEREENKKNE